MLVDSAVLLVLIVSHILLNTYSLIWTQRIFPMTGIRNQWRYWSARTSTRSLVIKLNTSYSVSILYLVLLLSHIMSSSTLCVSLQDNPHCSCSMVWSTASTSSLSGTCLVWSRATSLKFLPTSTFTGFWSQSSGISSVFRWGCTGEYDILSVLATALSTNNS